MKFLSNRTVRLIIPNTFTFLSSVSALIAIYVAYIDKSRYFAIFLLISGVMDMLDGPIARHLDAKSRFGNIYDSMADLLAFGVGPAMGMFFLGLLHPLVALFYILAIQFRLTRYSAMPDEESDDKFFQGVSSPDCVYLAILLGLIPYSNYHIGFLVMGLLAVYPGKLFPKGYRIVKLMIAIVTIFLFWYQG